MRWGTPWYFYDGLRYSNAGLFFWLSPWRQVPLNVPYVRLWTRTACWDWRSAIECEYTYIVSMSMMWMDPMGILHSTFSNSQPIPPTPTINIFSFCISSSSYSTLPTLNSHSLLSISIPIIEPSIYYLGYSALLISLSHSLLTITPNFSNPIALKKS